MSPMSSSTTAPRSLCSETCTARDFADVDALAGHGAPQIAGSEGRVPAGVASRSWRLSMDKTRPVSSATVVSVSFNTKKLTGLLLWSLDRILEPTDLSVLMVDNGSTDGTADLLRSAADAGLCDMILNRTNLGHGPALNLAIESAIPPSSEWVWVLDSDCVISRPDALTAPLGRQRDAAIIGEAKWDPWRRRSRLELYSLLVSRAALDLP